MPNKTAQSSNGSKSSLVITPTNFRSVTNQCQLAVLPITQDVDALIKSMEFIKASFYILVSTPSTQLYSEKAFSAIGQEQWCKLAYLDDSFDIGKMSRQLSSALERMGDIINEGLIIDYSGNNRFLWKAIDLATAKYKKVTQIFFDRKNDRCQICIDRENWSLYFLDSTTEEQSDITNEYKEDSSETVSNGQARIQTLRIQLCQWLWDFRKVITEPHTWKIESNQNSSYRRAVLQHLLTTLKPKSYKLKLQQYVEKKNITFNGQTLCQSLHFHDHDGAGNFSFGFKGWTQQEIHRFLGGCWFEEYVYNLANDLRNRSQSITNITKEEIVLDHEVDIVVSTRSRVYLIECKTGVVDINVVRKLKKLADLYTTHKGVEAIGLLVSLKPIEANSAVAQFVKQSNRLACIHGDNIPNRMKNLLTTQSKSFLG